MCLGSPVPGATEGRVVELRFQTRIHGHHTDDLLVVVETFDGQQGRNLLQVKRSLAARPSDKAFVESISAAWTDFSGSPEFRRGRDSIFIVFDVTSAGAMKGATTVCDWARCSASAEEFVKKVIEPNFSSSANRAALEAVRTIASNCASREIVDEELFVFAQHLNFLPQDLDHDGSTEHAGYLWFIQHAVSRGEKSTAHEVWSVLITACIRANSEAATVTLGNLGYFIGQQLASLFAGIRANSVSPLTSLQSSRTAAAMRGTSIDAVTAELARLTGLVESLQRNGPRPSVQDQLPTARDASVNKFISAQLDGVHARTKALRYQDALDDLKRLGGSIADFDVHQHARWLLLRATCRLHLEGPESAADDYNHAAELCNDEDKFAAARVRALLFKGDAAAALAAGTDALKSFPNSLAVWQVTANARMNLGEALSLTDIPPALRSEADAFQTLAWSRQRHGDKEGALEAALHALKAAPTSFGARDTALAMSLDKAAGDAVAAAFRMLCEEDRAELERCVAAFSPREEQLWQVQSPGMIAATATNLANALLLLGKADEALAVLQEARAHGLNSPHFIRVEYAGLADMGDLSKVLELGKGRLDHMPKDALAVFAQVAGQAGDLATVDKCLLAAKRAPSEPALVQRISAMRLTVLAGSDLEAALAEVRALDWRNAASVPVIVAAIEVLRRAGRQDDADPLVSHVLSLLPTLNESGDRHLVAQALFFLQRFEQAAEVYESLAPKGKHSELHANLLYCYLRSGQRAKAKHLLDTFPPGWERHEDTRQVAMELGQLAGDWELLDALLAAELEQAPRKARSWLFKVLVATRTAAEDVATALNDAPEDLTGSTRELTQLATLELRHGYVERALRRLYVMRRRRLDSTDVASAHLIAHTSVSDELPHMEPQLPIVVPGTAVTVIDDDGAERVYSIDPPGMPELPATEEFLRPDSAEAKTLIGLAEGEVLHIPGVDGALQTLRVASIRSVYRRLLELSHLAMDTSLAPSTAVQKVPLHNQETGEEDFSGLIKELKRFSHHARNAVEAYASSPLTLGRLAQLLGRNVVDLIRGWNTDGPPLQVSGGNAQERAKVVSQLACATSTYVIDAATLIELASLNCLACLSALPDVLVSAHTRDLVEGRLAEARLTRTRGTAFEHEGKLGFVEFSEADRLREVSFLESVTNAIRKYCRIVPAYGTEERASVERQLEQAISVEELSAVLASVEHKATLICLDARLRALATAGGVSGIWPQPLLMFARDKGVLPPHRYSLAIVGQLVANRTFISVASEDLALMAYQGTSTLTQGIGFLKSHLANPDTEFHSAARVAVAFFRRISTEGPCHIGAAFNLVEHLAEALFRHKDVPWKFDDALVTAFVKAIPSGHSSPELKAHVRRAVYAGLVAADKKANRGLRNVEVLMCSSPPWIAYVPKRGDIPAHEHEIPPTVAERVTGMDAETAASDAAANPYR